MTPEERALAVVKEYWPAEPRKLASPALEVLIADAISEAEQRGWDAAKDQVAIRVENHCSDKTSIIAFHDREIAAAIRAMEKPK